MRYQYFRVNTRIDSTELDNILRDIPDKVKTHAIRLVSQSGPHTAFLYLRSKMDIGKESVCRDVIMALWSRTTMKDIGTDKCLNCLWRTRCNGKNFITNKCNNFIDDRTPQYMVNRTIRVYANTATPRFYYDGGFLCTVDYGRNSIKNEIKYVPLKDLLKVITDGIPDTNMRIVTNPATDHLIKHGVFPKKGEDYNDYVNRVNTLVEELTAEVKTNIDPDKFIKELITKSGQLDVLNNVYGGSIDLYVYDVFSGKSKMDIIEDMNMVKPVSDKDVWEAIRSRKND